MGNQSAQGIISNERPRLSPDVPPYQCFREGPAGNTAKKDVNKNAFEAGICMKTNKSMTKCLEKIGHLCLRFGHFRLTDANFAEIRREFTVKRRQYRVSGRRSGLGRPERENPVRNVEGPVRGRCPRPWNCALAGLSAEGCVARICSLGPRLVSRGKEKLAMA
jgi:hypothetical protein